jgi:hypothetical protein
MKRHPLDPIALVFGLAFTIVGAVLLNTDVDLSDFTMKWVWPSIILFLGVVLGAVALRSTTRSVHN